MSSETDRYQSQAGDAKSFFNRILWRLLNWNPDAFELYSAIIWIIWGSMMISIPSEVHDARYGSLFRYVGSQTLGTALLCIGAFRLLSIVVSHFSMRRVMSFVTAVVWGGIAALLLWSSPSISAISHMIFAIVSGWSYLRMRE
jgi:hypothetical protein